LPATLGERFDCILPDHDHSAMLVRREGYWKYRCASGTAFGLAEVFAFRAYGEVLRLSPVQIVRWRERLRYEAGLVKPRPIPDLPTDLSASARRVGEGLRLFVGLRGEKWVEQPFPFARPFVMAYCDVTDERARRGVEELARRGVMRRSGGTTGRAILWLPGWSSDPPPAVGGAQ
jgi:hypothetical protein